MSDSPSLGFRMLMRGEKRALAPTWGQHRLWPLQSRRTVSPHEAAGQPPVCVGKPLAEDEQPCRETVRPHCSRGSSETNPLPAQSGNGSWETGIEGALGSRSVFVTLRVRLRRPSPPRPAPESN